MEHVLSNFGFRYKHNGKRYAVSVEAANVEDARARILAISEAEFISELDAQARAYGDSAASVPNGCGKVSETTAA